MIKPFHRDEDFLGLTWPLNLKKNDLILVLEHIHIYILTIQSFSYCCSVSFRQMHTCHMYISVIFLSVTNFCKII